MKCSCLTAYDSRIPHYDCCSVGMSLPLPEVDRSDVRWLAEKAADQDIDTSISCLRSVQYELKRLREQNAEMKAELLALKHSEKANRRGPKPKAGVR
jgi:hypothetical protein